MRVPRALAAGIIAAVAGVALLAQPPQQAQAQPPKFRGGTNLVRVDVTVSDKHGELVTDLTKDDFLVTEDGVPQTVETCRLVEATGMPTDDLSLPIRSIEHAKAEAARDDVRVFVILWDEYHIDRMEPAIRARAALSEFVQSAFAPTDLVAITDQLMPTDSITFTRNIRDLTDAVAKLKGRLGVYVPPRSALEEAQLYKMSDIERLRSDVTKSALEATVAFLGSIKEGRKSLLFVSEGIGAGDPRDQYDWLSQFIRRANDNNTAVYTLDPRGLGGQMSDILMSMSSETGGEAVRGNAPVKRMMQMVRDASAFYLLGYSPAKNPMDGKFHKIGVKVARPGIEVRARHGYYAPTLADMTTAGAKAAAAEAPPEVTRAMSALVKNPDDASSELWAGWWPTATGARVLVATSVDKEREHEVRIRAVGPDRRRLFDDVLSPTGTVSFEAPAGTIAIRRLTDDQARALDPVDVSVEVPDYANADLVIATPLTFKARTGVQVRDVSTNPDAAPYPGHEFERTDHLIAHFAVVGRRAAEATAVARLLTKAGASLATLPVDRPSALAGAYQVDLPMGSVAKGDYLIEFTATGGNASTKALLPFRVN